MGKTDLKATLQRASEAVRKRFSGAHSERASKDLVPVSQWASTGSLALDRAIARQLPGGVPVGPKHGWVSHFFGDPSIGKSALLDYLIKSVLDLGGVALVSETEGSRLAHFAQAIGLDLNLVEIQKPATLEELFDWGLEFASNFRRLDASSPLLWGVDSFEMIESERTYGVAMTGKESGKYDYGGGRSQVISAGCRKMAHICSTTPTSFIIINQVREQIGVLFGDRKKPTGGKMPRFFASVEVHLGSSEYGYVMNARKQRTGRWVRARVVKNKIAAPFAEAEFVIDFEKGVHRWAGLLESLEDDGVVAVKRKDNKRRGDLVGKEFTVTATGEVLPLSALVSWCARTGQLGELYDLAPEKKDRT